MVMSALTSEPSRLEESRLMAFVPTDTELFCYAGNNQIYFCFLPHAAIREASFAPDGARRL